MKELGSGAFGVVKLIRMNETQELYVSERRV
jgi:hypothetical protein